MSASKKNMRTNRSPRRIHRNKGARKKGVHYMSEQEYNKQKIKHRDPMDIVFIKK